MTLRDKLTTAWGETAPKLKRLAAIFPSSSHALLGFALHGTLASTIFAVVIVVLVGIKQLYEKPIAIGPFTVVSGADTYGITAEALSDQLKGQISLINVESGELFESRKLIDNALPLDITLGNTGWTFTTLTRAFGIRFTSAQISGRISKTGEFLVMQFTTAFGDRIQEERLEIPLPREPAKVSVTTGKVVEPDRAFLSAIAGQIDCMALKLVVGVTRDVAANYLHKQDEISGYDPDVGPKGKTDACVHGDDVNMYSDVREDRNAAPYMKVNALIGLSVHYQQTRQYYEALTSALGARALARSTMSCEDDPAILTLGKRLKCLLHRTKPQNHVAQIASWMQLGAAYSDYANVAPTTRERDGRRTRAITAYETVLKISPRYAPGVDALGLQYAFSNEFKKAADLYRKSSSFDDTTAIHLDWGIALIQGRDPAYSDKDIVAGDLDDAISHFELAIDAYPAYWDAHSQLGYALYLRKRYTDAADVLQVAVANETVDRHLRRLLASVLGDMCRFDDARTVFSTAYRNAGGMDATPKNSLLPSQPSPGGSSSEVLTVLADWGRALDGFGFHQVALDQENAVLARNPKQVDALVFRGTMRIAASKSNPKQVDDAIADFELAFKSDVSRSDFVIESYLLGLLRAGRSQQAVDRYENWASTGLVPVPATRVSVIESTFPSTPHLRVLYASALAASGHQQAADAELALLASSGIKSIPEIGDLKSFAGITVADEDKQISHPCRMGAWQRSPQFSEVSLANTREKMD